MALLGGQPHRQAETSLIYFAFFLLLTTFGASATFDRVADGFIWINGTAVLWETIDVLSFWDAIYEDIKRIVPGGHIKVGIAPNIAQHSAVDKPYFLKCDGLGLKVFITDYSETMPLEEFCNAFISSDLTFLNKLVYTTFEQHVKAIDIYMSTELYIDNTTIAISRPIKLWELYLTISKPLISKENVFQEPDEVLKYMPMDLQNALHADQSHYQIMPTSMWTNSTGAYVNYTVYAVPANLIPSNLRLTPEQVHNRLLGSPLPRFGTCFVTFGDT
ncbi:unnamed protein product [Phytomonas sp. Hart1]|nr:unnamed protein product [Phytomonas sp. Hart1]|eukprot:CCW66670.1 unnamed protein product [Phytomonas sp. isolate Hart1]